MSLIMDVQRGTPFLTCAGRLVRVCISSHLAHLYLHSPSLPSSLCMNDWEMSIYTVFCSQKKYCQKYLLYNLPWRNTVHHTCLVAEGNELAIPTSVVVSFREWNAWEVQASWLMRCRCGVQDSFSRSGLPACLMFFIPNWTQTHIAPMSHTSTW